MVPSGAHAPPRPKGASAMIWADPPSISMVFNRPSPKNAMERLSGDQKGKVAFSEPGMGCASSEFVGRSQSIVLLSTPEAAKAMAEPSGERTGGPAESPMRLSVVFSGGLMTVRMDCADGAGR